MKKAEIRKAQRLADMASGLNGLTYSVNETADVVRSGGSVWYPVTAHKGEQTWDYLLAAADGSWKGSFPAKTVKIDFVCYGSETPQQALKVMTKGFEVNSRIVREIGDTGHPVAEITGDPGEVDSLLMDLGYPVDCACHECGAECDGA